MPTIETPPAAVGIPVYQVEPRSYILEPAPQLEVSPSADEYLKSLNLPRGIQTEIKNAVMTFPYRTWIIDNSGSMATNDGHRTVQHGDRASELSVTRWEELCETLMWHGNLAAELRTPIEFRFLNPPGGGLPQARWLECLARPTQVSPPPHAAGDFMWRRQISGGG